MKYKIFGIDLDGTLLTKFKRISTKNLKAIKKYVLAGGIPVIITGRSIVSAYKYHHQIEAYVGQKLPYLSCFNGGLIKNVNTNEDRSIFFNNAIVKSIYNDVINLGGKCWVYTKNITWQNGVYATSLMFVSVFAKLFKNLNVTKLEPNDIKDVFKLVIYTYLPNVRKIGEYLSTKYKDMNEIVEHGPYCLEVTCKGVNKGYAISQIAESLNVPLDEVAIIGDSNNDVMAARVVGMSFAVTKKSKVLNELATHKYRKSKHCVANAINEHLLVE